MPLQLTAIIPTLNAADHLPRCLDALYAAAQDNLRVLVVDGGSHDATAALVAAAPQRPDWLNAPAGRGAQLAAGAEQALAQGAEWLLFLHADSLLPPQWDTLTAEHCAAHPQAVGYFALAFDLPPQSPQRPAAQRVAALANARARWLGLPYGDQGLLISAQAYRTIGGYNSALPLMEDVDLVRRLHRHSVPLRSLGAAVQTAPDRYQRGGWWRRPLKNLACLAAYGLGVPVERIAAWYRR